MKIVICALLCAVSINAQVLTSRYNFVTGVSGSTLTDLTGNGNNGTLHGTTPGATGITFNGTSDYISLPALVHDGDFTIIIFASSNSLADAYVFTENDATPTAGLNIMTHGKAEISSAGGGNSVAFPFPAWWDDVHCFYLSRSGESAVYGVLDNNIVIPFDLGTPSFTMSTTRAAFGARDRTTGPQLFWEGTIQYAEVWTGTALTARALATRYAAARAELVASNIYLKDLVDPIYPGRVWQPQGVVLQDVSGAVQESSPGYTTTDCQMMSNPCFQLWFKSGDNLMHYAEAPDTGAGPGVFVKYGSVVFNPYSGAQIFGARVAYIGGFYWVTVAAADRSALNIYRGTSPLGPFTSYQSSAITPGAGGQWDSGNNLWNSQMLFNGSTYYMWYEVTSPSGFVHGNGLGLATSSDAHTWTKSPANPLNERGNPSGCGTPSVQFVSSFVYVWCGGLGPAHLFRYYASTPHSKLQGSSPGSIDLNSPLPVFATTAPNEIQQGGDPRLIEVNGATYLYLTSQNTPGSQFTIKLAIAPMPISWLVQTGEGRAVDVP